MTQFDWLELLDDGSTCDETSTDGVYSVEFSPTFGGLHNWTLTVANDSSKNSRTV